MRVSLLLVVAVLVVSTFANHIPPGLTGLYIHCTENGDEVVMNIFDDDEYQTQMFITGGGCRGSQFYTIEAQFRIVFESASGSTWNVHYIYTDAEATPHSQKGLEALENTCTASSWAIGTASNVLGCLICPVQYDILEKTRNGFLAGEGNACTEADRPTDFEENAYTRTSFPELAAIRIEYLDFDGPSVPYSLGLDMTVYQQYLSLNDYAIVLLQFVMDLGDSIIAGTDAPYSVAPFYSRQKWIDLTTEGQSSARLFDENLLNNNYWQTSFATFGCLACYEFDGFTLVAPTQDVGYYETINIAYKYFSVAESARLLADDFLDLSFVASNNAFHTTDGNLYSNSAAISLYFKLATVGGDPHFSTFDKQHGDLRNGLFNLFAEKRVSINARVRDNFLKEVAVIHHHHGLDYNFHLSFDENADLIALKNGEPITLGTNAGNWKFVPVPEKRQASLAMQDLLDSMLMIRTGTALVQVYAGKYHAGGHQHGFFDVRVIQRANLTPEERKANLVERFGLLQMTGEHLQLAHTRGEQMEDFLDTFAVEDIMFKA